MNWETTPKIISLLTLTVGRSDKVTVSSIYDKPKRNKGHVDKWMSTSLRRQSRNIFFSLNSDHKIKKALIGTSRQNA